MTLLTGGELEILMSLRMSWVRLYSNEITRLRNEDDSKHAADCGVHLTDGLPNRDEEVVIRVLDEMSTRSLSSSKHSTPQDFRHREPIPPTRNQH
jgi:hypothetical protein